MQNAIRRSAWPRDGHSARTLARSASVRTHQLFLRHPVEEVCAAVATSPCRTSMACALPQGWCTHAGSALTLGMDCDADQVDDHMCVDMNVFGFISSPANCSSHWRNNSKPINEISNCSCLFGPGACDASFVWSCGVDSSIITGGSRCPDGYSLVNDALFTSSQGRECLQVTAASEGQNGAMRINVGVLDAFSISF